MKIYTRTGDKGMTSLLGGMRISKSHARVEAYGTVDELNSAIGLALAFLSDKKHAKVKKELIRVQSDLLEIGSNLSSPTIRIVEGLEKRAAEFEKEIDTLTEQMPVLRNFILPGGGKAGAVLHVCRTIARRAERRIVALSESEGLDEHIVLYMNRLSDLLFTMARFANFKDKHKEIVHNL
jgi:cob(I)alamin adenosyltransferase